MAERTMKELLQAPTEGYGEAIVIPEINADHFEIKTNLLQLVQANQFHGFERDNPHTHINNFKRITSTLKFRDVLNDVIKLMMFPYSLEGAARVKIEELIFLKDDSISPEIDHADCDPEGDICLIEKLLNNDPFQLPPMDLKQGEVIKAKSSIEEPPELELKDLPSHLEYVYLEENDKLPVIIAKGLKDDEKEAP
ncbi:hypothetical protein Tco_0492777 [Tanacetum coccineum]